MRRDPPDRQKRRLRRGSSLALACGTLAQRHGADADRALGLAWRTTVGSGGTPNDLADPQTSWPATLSWWPSPPGSAWGWPGWWPDRSAAAALGGGPERADASRTGFRQLVPRSSCLVPVPRRAGAHRPPHSLESRPGSRMATVTERIPRAACALDPVRDPDALDASTPRPGSGRTWIRWRALAEVGSRDLVQARLGEGHVDAIAILAELEPGRPIPSGAPGSVGPRSRRLEGWSRAATG